jgi:hypothetical protein
MASTPRDNNGRPTLLGTLDTDGKTVVSIKASPVGRLKTANGTTGNNYTVKTTSQRDDNRVTAIWGVSSVDGVTPVYIAVNSSGELLTKST